MGSKTPLSVGGAPGGGSGEKMKNSKVIRTLKELLRFFEKLKYLDFNYRDIDTLPNLKV